MFKRKRLGQDIIYSLGQRILAPQANLCTQLGIFKSPRQCKRRVENVFDDQYPLAL